MKAWQVKAWGEPESLELNEVAVPVVGPGQVLVRVAAAGLNFFDLLQVRGQYQIKPPFPFTPGAEVAGVVEAVGAGVTRFAVGNRVMGFSIVGGFGELCVVPEARCFAVPAGFSMDEAAGFPIVSHTGWYALERRARLQKGETLLVQAGASGVGMAAIQIGKALGARVIATAGSEAKREFARARGADEVLDYSTPAWVETVKALTGGRGADVIYDPVGGDVFDESTRCIAFDGRLLIIGFTSGRIPLVNANIPLIKGFAIVGVRAGEMRAWSFGFDPSTPGPYNTLAQIRQAQGDPDGARKLFAQAAEVKKKLEMAQAKRLGTMGPATRDLPRPAR